MLRVNLCFNPTGVSSRNRVLHGPPLAISQGKKLEACHAHGGTRFLRRAKALFMGSIRGYT